MKLLIVEDDQTIASGLEYSLTQEGYQVTVCHNVQEAIQIIDQQLDSISLCLFDLSLPDGSGYDLCRRVKETADVPVIFLTVVDDEVNVVMGLDMGADDYITKPFRIRELSSRIKTVLRRYQKSKPQAQEVITIHSLEVHPLEGKVYKHQEELILTALEYRLLMIFINHRGQILSREQLLELIWDVAGEFVNDNTLTVYIKRLRQKIEDNAQQPVIIQTVRGLGYRMVDKDVKK
ncbi:response regulator transcription factor [Gracilibacillus alcaliphilus]|uniref:response regulator transcription factor n=1 Tax=Gracilibacillus alcaliphilus TaxID=1401441 RepID=UPI00195D591C|nr:response regulator transcription factor [Gracilibacillus alcaliphilus]MBM7676486.1 DNA-binding response OmpR family regulator [Gracilibacillus alcaliphilus]